MRQIIQNHYYVAAIRRGAAIGALPVVELRTTSASIRDEVTSLLMKDFDIIETYWQVGPVARRNA